MAHQQSQGYTEYRVKLTGSNDKTYHVMRFKPPHKCDLEKLVNPTLDRQVSKTATVVEERETSLPTEGEGSEYGRKWKDEVRKKRRGYSRKQDPDDNPWVLKEKKRGGKHFIGRKEGTVNTSSSYYILSRGNDGAFEALPVESWYDFVPPVKYNYLDADEAEERFERRDKTLNYFSIMLSKRLKGQQEEGEGLGEEGAALDEGPGSKRSKKLRRKTREEEDGLMLTDSDDSDSSSDEEDESARKKKVGGRSKKKSQGSEDEAGEETDEGDMESREVDYMSDSSSDSEHEFQAKQALKEAPKDDEALDRQEEGEIDKGFIESSSSSEDELTEEGKEIQALLKMQTTEEEPSSQELDDSITVDDSPNIKASKKESPGKSKKKSSNQASSQQGGTKREREQESSEQTAQTTAAPSPDGAGTSSAAPGTSGSGSQPPAKKHRTEYSPSTITEEEVQRYLKRRPICSNDLVKKFKSKKTEMDKKRVVEVLHKLIQGMKNVEKQTIKGKMYLSLKTAQEEGTQ